MKLKGISRNVVMLGWVSFLTDVASEMLYPIMPLFVVGVLGAGPAALGLIDGLAEGISSMLRWISGALSDRFSRRKPFIVAGYGLSSVSKPLMGLAQSFGGWPMFLVGRITDRLGKSIRTSARDALIADSTEPQYRGRAFGLHRAMDTSGAVLGPLLALGLVIWLVGWSNTFGASWSDHAALAGGAIARLPLQWLFFAALIPGLASAFLAVAGVKEIRRATVGQGKVPSILQPYPRRFWWLLAAVGLFSLGNSSDSFLILRSAELGLSFGAVILAFSVYNTIYALGSLPLGSLSDRIGRKPLLVGGWTIYALIYLAFAITHSSAAPWTLLACYGLYQAMSEGVSKALVADLVGPDMRAGAIGLFYTVAGLGQLFASLLAGFTWNVRIGGLMAPFLFGAGFSLAGAVMLGMLSLKNPAEKISPA